MSYIQVVECNNVDELPSLVMVRRHSRLFRSGLTHLCVWCYPKSARMHKVRAFVQTFHGIGSTRKRQLHVFELVGLVKGTLRVKGL